MEKKTTKKTKKSRDKELEEAAKELETAKAEQPVFEQLVDSVLAQLKDTTLKSYARKDAGAFKFGVAGLKVMATELLDQASEYQGFFSAASFSLAAALLSVGAYQLKSDPSYEQTNKVPTEPEKGKKKPTPKPKKKNRGIKKETK